MAFWRAMRASHHSACAVVASADQPSPCLARDFPFLPCLAEGGVEPGAEGLQGLLPRLPDHVDLGIVGDGFEGDVRHALVDEALADVATRRRASDGARCVISASLRCPSGLSASRYQG